MEENKKFAENKKEKWRKIWLKGRNPDDYLQRAGGDNDNDNWGDNVCGGEEGGRGEEEGKLSRTGRTGSKTL